MSITTEQRLAQSIGIPIEIKQIPIGKHAINYITAGSGKPVLLIHGANIGWGQWYPNLPAFAEKFTVYALDLPGAGRSSRIDCSQLDPEKDLFEVVDRFISTLNLGRLSIVGSSIGGWIAVKLALAHPEKIDKLVLVNSVGFTDYMSAGDRVIGFYPLAQIIAKTILRPTRGNKNIEKFLRSAFFDKFLPLRPEFIDYFYETIATSHNLLLISRLTKLMKTFILIENLPKIKNRTLIIWGEQDHIVPLTKNRYNFNLIPNVMIRLMSEAGHIPSMEQSFIFNNAAIDFLKD